MQTITLVKTWHVFPKGSRGYRIVGVSGVHRRGMGTMADELAIEAAYLPSAPSSFWQNIWTGTPSPAQIQLLQDQTYVANAQAATNPITGQVNQSLRDQANAQAAPEIAAGANVSNVSTGSWLANLTDQLQGTYTGKLGLPGFTPPLGTAVEPADPNNPTGIDWTSLLETVALLAGAGVGIYFIAKAM